MTPVIILSPASRLATPTTIKDELLLFLLLVVEGIAIECINSSRLKGFWYEFLDAHLFTVLSVVNLSETLFVNLCLLVTLILFVIFMSLYFVGLADVIRCLSTFFLSSVPSGAQIFHIGIVNPFAAIAARFMLW